MSERKMWEKNEDNMIKNIVQENERRSQQQKWKWSEIAQILQARIPGCRRSGKQCRERWYNHLNPAIIQDKSLTNEQINKLFDLQNKMGNRWANIAKQFPGRTDNNLKNFFYSSLRRAIRQINFFVAHYKKKSNIKPFKQSILTKILNINDEKYKQKLDIKNDEAQILAQSVKQMLAKLSLQQQDAELTRIDIQFRQRIVKSIQDFNKSCKKRKSKKIEQQQEPDLENLSKYNNDYKNSQSYESKKANKRKPTKQKKTLKKRQDSSQSKSKLKEMRNHTKKIQKTNKTQRVQTRNIFQNNGQIKSLFQKPRVDDYPPPPMKKQSFQRWSQINQQDQNQNRINKIDSKKSSSRINSSSSNKYPFNLQSSDLKQSNMSYGEMQPAGLGIMTRRSSIQCKDRLSFVPSVSKKMSKTQSKYQGLFTHFIPDNIMLQSLNIGQNIGKLNQGSVNESGLFKMSKVDSKIDPNFPN